MAISYQTINSRSNQDLVRKIASTSTNGIEGLPYQFPASVDRRLDGAGVGRKYADKIFGRLPLLFLTPCEPLFMQDFNENDSNLVRQALLGLISPEAAENFMGGSGKYYSTKFAFDEYYKYLNPMLSCVAAYMGIFDERITIPNTSIENQRIGTINWQNELNRSFKTFFSAKANLIFYLDSFDSVSESLSNDTTESSLASQINGFSDQINEIRFLFGNDSQQSAIADLMNKAGDTTSTITSSISSALGNFGGGIVESLSNKGVRSILDGGKIIFPEIWSNSDFSRSYNLEIKLRSPDNDNLSIFLNIIKPYCKLLALTLPRQLSNHDPNSYGAPFLVKAYSKGMFNVDMGIISSMSVTKGATAQWNDDGLPTQLDISIDVKDLYSKFAMSKINNTSFSGITGTDAIRMVNNTSYMDFLANMSGLNIGQMQMARRLRMAYYLGQTTLPRLEGEVFTKFDATIDSLFGKFYNIL